MTPGAIGEAVNAGLIARDQTTLIWWGLAVLGLGVVMAVSALLVERDRPGFSIEPALS